MTGEPGNGVEAGEGLCDDFIGALEIGDGEPDALSDVREGTGEGEELLPLPASPIAYVALRKRSSRFDFGLGAEVLPGDDARAGELVTCVGGEPLDL